MNVFRIGMVGLDTSHVPAFANLLHDTSHEYHVPGARIVAAFPGGSPDFEMSINRVPKYTEEMRDKHQVEIVNSLSALRGKCDALMLESIDGRVHLAQFREVADWGVPVFIDKPLTVSTVEARELVRIAKEKKVRMTSASAMRFAASFQQALHADTAEPVIGGDFYGPMQWQEKCPGYFWYGIHTVEMLFAAMGTGCCEVHSFREELHDVVVGRWTDGRLGMVRGNRAGNPGFGGVIHRKNKSFAFDISTGTKPFYASLLEKIIPFFKGQAEVVPPAEMIEVIAFLEAANHSATSKQRVTL